MNFKTAVAAAALALTTAGAGAVNLGALDLSTGSASFGNTPVSGVFSDFFTFTLTQASLGTSSLTSNVIGGQDVDFSSITVTGPSGPYSFSQFSFDPVEAWTLPAAGVFLSPGAYTVTLLGVNSPDGGSYGGNFAVTTAAIPEPETYALMLAGLGAVGFIARRRKAGKALA